MPQTRLSIKKTCPSCKSEFTTNRQKAIYCCPACRVKGHRERHGIVTRKSKSHTECQREGCSKRIPESYKSTAKYCSNACRQKVYNEKNKDKVKEQYAESVKEKKDAKAVEEFIQELMGE